MNTTGIVTSLHIRRENVKSFVEIVHLNHNAACYDDGEDVGAWRRKLIIAAKREFHSNAESFDGHHADGTD